MEPQCPPAPRKAWPRGLQGRTRRLVTARKLKFLEGGATDSEERGLADRHDAPYDYFSHRVELDSCTTEQSVREALAILTDKSYHGRRMSSSKERIKSLLEACTVKSSMNSVANYCDATGFDILQRAVVLGWADIVEQVLNGGYDIRLLSRPCSSPLHLACRYGHLPILRMFLDRGACIGLKSTTCFPVQRHSLITQTPPREFVQDGAVSSVTNSCNYAVQRSCRWKRSSVLSVVLHRDDVDQLQLLLTHPTSALAFHHASLLHYACEADALHCLEFLGSVCPKHCGPVKDQLLGVAITRSEDCALTLLKSDIQWDWSAANLPSGTVLHEAYRGAKIQHCHEFTQLLLEHCHFPRRLLKCTDLRGNTVLFVLLQHLGHGDGAAQIYPTVCYLVEQGADPHHTNTSGETTLHALMSDNFYRRLSAMNLSQYEVVLPEMGRVLEYLLSQGVDPLVRSLHAAPVLTWTVHILCGMEAEHVEAMWPALSYIFSLLLRHGANPNDEDERGICVVSLLLTASNRWLTQCAATEGRRASSVMRHVASLFSLLCSAGLAASEPVLDLCTKQLAILCNINVGMAGAEVIGSVRAILAALLTNGVDLHMLQLVRDLPDSDTPCELHAQFYLARACIVQTNDTLEPVLQLLEETLQQESLAQLMGALCTILKSNFTATDPVHVQRCVSRLTAAGQTPRPLRSLARIAIAQCVEWRLRAAASRLPLPKLMQHYLISFE